MKQNNLFSKHFNSEIISLYFSKSLIMFVYQNTKIT